MLVNRMFGINLNGTEYATAITPFTVAIDCDTSDEGHGRGDLKINEIESRDVFVGEGLRASGDLNKYS